MQQIQLLVEENYPLTAIELKWSFFRLIEKIKKANFPEEILKNYKSPILLLNNQRLIFIHTTLSLIEADGKLLNAVLKYNTKFSLLDVENYHAISSRDIRHSSTIFDVHILLLPVNMCVSLLYLAEIFVAIISA